MTIFDDNFYDNFLMTIIDGIETIFDNWKDSPGDLTLETLITILTIENLNSDNHSYLAINCDTGQHSQFLRCLDCLKSSKSITLLSSKSTMKQCYLHLRWYFYKQTPQEHLSNSQISSGLRICCEINHKNLLLVAWCHNQGQEGAATGAPVTSH